MVGQKQIGGRGRGGERWSEDGEVEGKGDDLD
jgi:hypothetical protein